MSSRPSPHILALFAVLVSLGGTGCTEMASTVSTVADAFEVLEPLAGGGSGSPATGSDPSGVASFGPGSTGTSTPIHHSYPTWTSAVAAAQGSQGATGGGAAGLPQGDTSLGPGGSSPWFITQAPSMIHRSEPWMCAEHFDPDAIRAARDAAYGNWGYPIDNSPQMAANNEGIRQVDRFDRCREAHGL